MVASAFSCMSKLCFYLVVTISLIGLGLALDVPFVVGEISSDLSSYTSDHQIKASSSSTDLVGVPPVSSLDDYDTIKVDNSINKSINQSPRDDNNTTESVSTDEINFSTEVPPGEIQWSNGPDANYYLQMGNSYYKEPSSDYANALRCYEEGIKLRPSDANLTADLWYGKGNALLKLARYNDSLAAYDMAIGFKPNYRDAWVTKCRIQKALNYDSSNACSRLML